VSDEHFYAKVVEELKLHGPVAGLWAKAFAESNGDEPKSKALYLRYRVEQLKTAEAKMEVSASVAAKPLESARDVDRREARYAWIVIFIVSVVFLVLATRV
jgi:hypothetical protein